MNLTPLQKLPKNVRDLDKLIVAKGFKKLPNPVTLVVTYVHNEIKPGVSSVQILQHKIYAMLFFQAF